MSIPPAAYPFLGATGTTELLALLDEETPLVLTVAIVKVYEVPLVKPETVIGDVALVAVNPPGEDVAV
jgi:hypothetical protein